MNNKNIKIKREGIFNLYEELSKLSDVRRDEGKRHKIELIVILVILAIMSGYHGFRATGDFIIRNKKEIITFFKPKKNRLPSFSTIRRVMNNINFDELCEIFEKWAKNYIEIEEKEWISLDGKAIRGTIPKEEHKFVNIVSLFAIDKKLVYSMGNVDEKSNEIPKVQELIDNFPAKKVVFRMDALHCQKKTIKKILEKQSYYVIQVKNNQKKLYKKVKFITKYLPKVASNIMREKNKGRLEKRELIIYREALDLKYEWDNLKYILKITRTVKHKNGKTSEETAYFITNLRESAKFFNKGVRNHWKIENSLHYIKDVVFKEDSLKIRSGMAPQNFSLLRSFVMNVLRKNGYTKIMQATRLLALDIGAMMALLC